MFQISNCNRRTSANISSQCLLISYFLPIVNKTNWVFFSISTLSLTFVWTTILIPFVILASSFLVYKIDSLNLFECLIYGGILLPAICEINYVYMQNNCRSQYDCIQFFFSFAFIWSPESLRGPSAVG